MKKHDIVEGVIDTYEFPNKGSFHMDDRKVTVKGAIKGQKVSCRITKLKKGKADGRLLEVLEKSELEDASPVCSHFGMCGGCSYQTLSYENQLKVKEELVKGLLDGVIDSEVHPYEWQGIIASPVTKGYRNKMEFSFGDEYKDGPLALGLHKKNSTYDIVQMDDCYIVNDDLNKIVKYTVQFCKEAGLPYYKKMQHEGLLRHLVIRRSATNGDLLVNLVTQGGFAVYLAVTVLNHGVSGWSLIFYIPIEVIITLVELLLYRRLLTEKNKARAAVYAIAANLCSAVFGLWLIDPLWHFIVSIS